MNTLQRHVVVFFMIGALVVQPHKTYAMQAPLEQVPAIATLTGLVLFTGVYAIGSLLCGRFNKPCTPEKQVVAEYEPLRTDKTPQIKKPLKTKRPAKKAADLRIHVLQKNFIAQEWTL